MGRGRVQQGHWLGVGAEPGIRHRAGVSERGILCSHPQTADLQPSAYRIQLHVAILRHQQGEETARVQTLGRSERGCQAGCPVDFGARKEIVVF